MFDEKVSDKMNRNANASVGITARYKWTCGDEVLEMMIPEGGSFEVTSPNYPDDYPDGVDCRMEFTVSSRTF